MSPPSASSRRVATTSRLDRVAAARSTAASGHTPKSSHPKGSVTRRMYQEDHCDQGQYYPRQRRSSASCSGGVFQKQKHQNTRGQEDTGKLAKEKGGADQEPGNHMSASQAYRIARKPGYVGTAKNKVYQLAVGFRN